MRYQDALQQAQGGKALCVSNAGGRLRYAKFDQVGSDVQVTLFSTVIAVHHEDGSVTIDTGGYNTRTTRDALNAVTLCDFHTVNGALHVNGRPMKDGMRIRPGFFGRPNLAVLLEPGNRDVPLDLANRGMTRPTKTVCYGVDRDTGCIVSKLGNEYAWPVLDFAGMTPLNSFEVSYDLTIIHDREIQHHHRPMTLGKRHIDAETRQHHEAFWLNAKGKVTA